MSKKVKSQVLNGLGVAAALAIAALAAFQAHADTDAGEGAGARTPIGAPPESLEDLVNPVACVWTSGETILKEMPLVKQMVASVEKLDWYFAFDLKRRLVDREFCFTHFLKRPELLEAAACGGAKESGYETDFTQAAIYTEDGIYIDQAQFNSMDDSDRASLLTHQPIHSYVASVCSHRSHVAGMARALDKIASGEISSRRGLYAAMAKNQVDFPRGTNEMDSQKAHILYTLSDPAKRRSMLMASKNPAELIEPRQMPSRQALLENDYAVLYGVYTNASLELIKPYCDAQDGEAIARMTGKLQTLDITEICGAFSAK